MTGEPAAVQIVDSAADALGSSLGWLVNVLDPEAIVVGGGLGLAPGRFRERLIKATRGSHLEPGGARTAVRFGRARRGCWTDWRRVDLRLANTMPSISVGTSERR